MIGNKPVAKLNMTINEKKQLISLHQKFIFTVTGVYNLIGVGV